MCFAKIAIYVNPKNIDVSICKKNYSYTKTFRIFLYKIDPKIPLLESPSLKYGLKPFWGMSLVAQKVV